MNTTSRNIDTLLAALAELDELLKDKGSDLAELIVELLDRAMAKKIITKSKEILEWLAARLQELTDGAEALDVLATLAEVVLDLFRFFKTGAISIDLPGLDELQRIFPSGQTIDDIQEAFEWLPDPAGLETLNRHVFALIDPITGGINQVLHHIELNTTIELNQ